MAAPGEHCECVNLDNSHPNARSTGLACWFASSTPAFLGILLFAQQFTTASASSLFVALRSLHIKFDPTNTKLDLIGLISTFVTEAATKSLTYSALSDDSLYFTGHIGPGTLSVAAALFEATGFNLAYLFALGGRADAFKLARLECPQGLRYIGLNSNTDCPVANAVGACVVREHKYLWENEWEKAPLDDKETLPLLGRRKGRDAKREVKVITLEVSSMQGQRVVMLKSSKLGFFLLGWLPFLLTLGVIAVCILCEEAFIAGLIALGTLGMSAAVLGLRLCRFEYAKPKPAKGAPGGICLVVDDNDADTLHVIEGKEEDIQALFQRKIAYKPSLGKYTLFLAGSMLYVYVIASVLYMPNVSISGQILFTIANLIGLVMDMVKASKNGQLGIAKKACEQFEIEVRDSVVFQNRTAAVAFVAKHARDRSMLKSKKLLPSDGPVWQKWWEELANSGGKVTDDTSIQDEMLLTTLLDDMRDGLKA